MSLFELLSDFNRSEYQRDNFDDFLASIKFTYSVPSIHIAGTNGKGSTASYIAAILKNAGYKTGLFTSPWLVHIEEMIKINGIDITEAEFTEIFKVYEKQFKKYELSVFEIQTFVALTYFMKQGCDVAVVECGMGGETDATNVFDSILSVITSISLEHTEFLGKSLSEIASNKCGIISRDIPVIIGKLSDEAEKTIVDYARPLKSKVIQTVEPSNVRLTDVGYKFDYLTYFDNTISSKAEYSVKDACIALEAIAQLSTSLKISNEAVKLGLAEVDMPCRLSLVNKTPRVYVDGAHNPEGMENLTESIQKMGGLNNVHTVFCCFRDKNITNMISSIGTVSESLTLTTFDHPRARGEMDYFLFLGDYEFRENPIELIKELMEKYPDDTILVCGSLAFAGYIKNQFDKGIL